MDPYRVLGVDKSATDKDISKAFRSKARLLHPDKQPPGTSKEALDKATKCFQELVKAYELISNSAARSKFEASGSGSSPSAPAPQTDPYVRTTEGGGPRPKSKSRSKRPQPQKDPSAEPAGHQGYRTANEEEEKRQQEEFDLRERLGSHWVKPQPPGSGNVSAAAWKGWTQSHQSGASTDSESDASSVLSFDIGISLDGLDLSNLEPATLEEDRGEVWNLGQQHQNQPRPSAGPQKRPSGAQAPGNKTSQLTNQSRCMPHCSLQ
mmetsp:Transcript_9295/g.13738  ORF Transcript_9295/g.13738 Transcript_9295/m.13738 type:complete len:264 (-) Transcript_9295:25-816(-)